MIKDITGIPLYPGNLGKNCLGNGEHTDIPICCDECDYILCCIQNNTDCSDCNDYECPRNNKTKSTDIQL